MTKLRSILGAACITATVAFPTFSLAEDHSVSEEFKHEAMEKRDDHYHVDAPATTGAAHALLKDALAKEQEAFKAGQLEEMHKASYALEAAVDALREQKAHESILIDNLDEAVQIIHYASEQENKEVLASGMPTLEKAVQAVLEN